MLFISLAFKQTLSKVSADRGRFAENHSLLKSPGFMLPGGGCGPQAWRFSASGPPVYPLGLDRGAAETNLYGKENNKSRKGEGGGGGRFGSRHRLQEAVAGWGVAMPTAPLWGWSTVSGWVGSPWTLYRRQVSLLLAFHPSSGQSGPLPGALGRSRGGGGAWQRSHVPGCLSSAFNQPEFWKHPRCGF